MLLGAIVGGLGLRDCCIAHKRNVVLAHECTQLIAGIRSMPNLEDNRALWQEITSLQLKIDEVSTDQRWFWPIARRSSLIDIRDKLEKLSLHERPRQDIALDVYADEPPTQYPLLQFTSAPAEHLRPAQPLRLKATRLDECTG